MIPVPPTPYQVQFLRDNGVPVPATKYRAQSYIRLIKQGLPCFPMYKRQDWAHLLSGTISMWYQESVWVPSRGGVPCIAKIQEIRPIKPEEAAELRKMGFRVVSPIEAITEYVAGPTHLIGKRVTVPFHLISQKPPSMRLN